MDRTSKNGIDLIGISGGKLKGVWGKAFLGALMYVAPIIAVCAIPYAGWAIAIALFGWLTAGYIEFMKKLLKGEKVSYATIFCTTKEFAQATLIGVILCCGTILGTILFIIPGILMVGYYSLSLFVLNEQSITGVTDTLNVTAKKMQGNKTSMFAYKVIYYLFYALIAVAGIIAFLFIAKLYETQAALAVILGIVDVLVCIVLLAVVTVYFYASNVVFYEEIIKTQAVTDYELTKPVEGANASELNIAATGETAPVVEEKVVEKVEVKPAEKVVEKKPATTTKKPAAKTATKKTDTKPAEVTKTSAKKPAAKTTTKK